MAPPVSGAVVRIAVGKARAGHVVVRSGDAGGPPDSDDAFADGSETTKPDDFSELRSKDEDAIDTLSRVSTRQGI